MQYQPFIERFETDSHKYIYDVNSNHFLRVDEVTYKIATDAFLPRTEIYQKWGNYQSNQINISLDKIHNLFNSKGLFSANRPHRFGNYDDIVCIENTDYSLRQVNLEVTQDCNMRCYYCPYTAEAINRRKHRAINMSYKTAMKAVSFFVNNLKNCEYPAITFYGGEPLLSLPLIKAVIEFAESKCNNVHFGITTNGTLLNRDIIDYFARHNVFVTLSLDGPSNIHDRYRILANGNPTHQLVVKNIQYMSKVMKNVSKQKSLRPYFGFNVTISPPYYLEELMEYFDGLYRQYRNTYSVNHVSTFESDIFSDKNLFRVEYAKEIKSMRSMFKDQLIRGDNLSPFMMSLFGHNLRKLHRRGHAFGIFEMQNPLGACIPGVHRYFVDAQGSYFICERMTDFNAIGDVEGSFDKRQILKIYNEFCRLCEINGCCDCWAVRFCDMCYVSVKKNRKLDLSRMKITCKMTNNIIRDDVILFLEAMEANPTAFSFFDEEVVYDAKKGKFVRFNHHDETDE